MATRAATKSPAGGAAERTRAAGPTTARGTGTAGWVDEIRGTSRGSTVGGRVAGSTDGSSSPTRVTGAVTSEGPRPAEATGATTSRGSLDSDGAGTGVDTTGGPAPTA